MKVSFRNMLEMPMLEFWVRNAAVSAKVTFRSVPQRRPLLHAPKICAEMPGSRSFDANFAEWGKDRERKEKKEKEKYRNIYI